MPKQNFMKFHILILLTTFLLVSATIYSQQPPPPPPPPADTIEVNDKIFERVEFEADYPGGINEWVKYLQRNLRADVPVDLGAAAGKYTVLVQFIVNLDGSITDITPLTNLGYGMEQEVIRIIKQSGKWTPAIQNGRTVKAYRRQPVTFMVEDDEINIVSKVRYVLFAKTDNALTLKVFNVKTEDVQVTISEGSIIHLGDGRYIARVTRPGRVILRVFNSKKKTEVGAVSFEVRE